MAESIAAIVFDLDGTLVDSVPDLQAALNAVLADEQYPPLDRETVESMIGDGVGKLVERGFTHYGAHLPPEELTDRLQVFLAHYEADLTRHTRPYPSVVETLERLRADGHVLAVCTNKKQNLSDAVVRQLGLSSYFQTVTGGRELLEPKPHPAPLLATLSALAVPHSKAVMVGDSKNDVIAARRAGTRCIAVTYGYGGTELEKTEPDVTISRFDDLPDAIRKLDEGQAAPGRRSPSATGASERGDSA